MYNSTKERAKVGIMTEGTKNLEILVSIGIAFKRVNSFMDDMFFVRKGVSDSKNLEKSVLRRPMIEYRVSEAMLIKLC